MEISELVKQLPYWKELSSRERDCVEGSAKRISYTKGEMLRGKMDSCLGMLHVLSGSIRVYMISDEGREITLYHLDAGDSCVLSASCVLREITFETQMMATEDTVVLSVPTGIYNALMESNLSVKCFTYELTTQRFSSVVHVMQRILFSRFEQRLALFLLEYSERTGRSEIRLTQEIIAQEVNSAREVVARMLKQFAGEGLIELKRGAIRITNEQGLRNLL